MQKIILASQSPRRKQLLEWADIPFDVVVQHTDEHYPAHLAVQEVPVHIALHKATVVQAHLQHVQSNMAQAPILAADTIVVLDHRIIGKPADRAEAIETLHALEGHLHSVITGVAIMHRQEVITFYERTEVQFHPLSASQIAYYVDKYQPYDKAGAYAIQEWIGVVGIQSINGDFYNVMGLPVSRVVQALSRLKP